MSMAFYWECAPDGGVRLLRAFGEIPEVHIPDFIEGKPVTEIGAYCFAADAHLPEAYRMTREAAGLDCVGAARLRELAGDYPTAVFLPDTVRKIGGFAFYNCVFLAGLTLGGRMTELGGDAFMNCGKLHRLTLRCGAGEKSGARQILGQIAADLEVTFLGADGAEAAVLFPEYYESYDEVAPAHLFGRNIEGEGFRARQCFCGEVFDFARYDTIFPKACAGESEETLCVMAMNRLRYPVGLAEPAKRLYETYIAGHAEILLGQAVARKETEPIAFLCVRGLLEQAALTACIAQAAKAGWAEGTVCLQRLKEQYFPKMSVRERYVLPD